MSCDKFELTCRYRVFNQFISKKKITHIPQTALTSLVSFLYSLFLCLCICLLPMLSSHTSSFNDDYGSHFFFVLSIIYLSVALFPEELGSVVVVTFSCCCCCIKAIQSCQEEVQKLLWETRCLFLFSLRLKKEEKPAPELRFFFPQLMVQ